MIYAYNYKPSIEYITAKGEKIPKELINNYNNPQRVTTYIPYLPQFCTIGIEVEFERLSKYGKVDEAVFEIAHLISNANCYVKHDGSLQNGYELVSQPRSLMSWFESNKQFNELFSAMRKLGLRSFTGGRCGLHVHVGYQSFENDLHVYRFVKFIHSNPSFMIQLSGRTEPNWVEQYCRLWNPKEIAWSMLFGQLKPATLRRTIKSSLSSPYGQYMCPSRGTKVGHHDAVSLTDGTVELRLFRGSLNTEKIYAIFQFIMMLISFTDYNRSLCPKATDFLEYAKKVGTNSLLWKKLLGKIKYNGEEKHPPMSQFVMNMSPAERMKLVIVNRNKTMGIRRSK